MGETKGPVIIRVKYEDNVDDLGPTSFHSASTRKAAAENKAAESPLRRTHRLGFAPPSPPPNATATPLPVDAASPSASSSAPNEQPVARRRRALPVGEIVIGAVASFVIAVPVLAYLFL